VILEEPVDLGSWLSLRALKVDTLAEYIENWLLIVEDDQEYRDSIYADVLDSLDVLSPSFYMETDLKEVLMFCAEHLLDSTFTASDSTDFFDYATMCPWEGGMSVGLAQRLYSVVADSVLSNVPYECPEPEPYILFPPVSFSNTYEGQISVYPNPTTGKITINLPGTNGELIITQLQSLLPVQNNQWANMSKMSLDMNTLPPGVYLITAITQAEIYTAKLILTR
jgi:hypothetical protein